MASNLLLVDVWGGPNYYPSLSLGYLASSARKSGFTVRIITPNQISNFSVELFGQILEKEKPSVVGFAGYTMEMFNTYKLMNKAKQWNGECKVILGGAHANALGEEVFDECKAIDAAFVFAEGEEGIVEFLKAGNSSQGVKGTLYRGEGGKIIKNPPRDFSKNIDQIPHPARDAYHKDEYHDVEVGGDSNFLAKPIHILVSSRGCPYNCNFCTPPETEVFTERGLAKIGEIREGEKVLAAGGIFERVSTVFKREYDGELVSIEVAYCAEPVKLTPNHNVFAFNAKTSSVMEKPAGELCEGDLLCIPFPTATCDLKVFDSAKLLEGIVPARPRADGLVGRIKAAASLASEGISTRGIASAMGIGKTTAWAYVHLGAQEDLNVKKKLNVSEENVSFTGAQKQLKRFISVDAEFMRLAGYYLAEGNVSISKNRINSGLVQFTFNAKEKEYIDDVAGIIEKTFSTNVALHANKANNTMQVTVQNTAVAHFFNKLFATGSSSKKIPFEFMLLPLEKQAQLLKGFFRGDSNMASFKPGNGFTAATASKTLATQIRLLLLRQGIVCSLYVDRRLKRKTPKAKHDLHLVTVFGNKCEQKLAKLLGLEIEIPNTRNHSMLGKIIGNALVVPVKRVSREKYAGIVYNLEVERDHSYTAQNLAVHNCVKSFGVMSRRHSVDYVIEEIREIRDKHGGKELFFIDDLFAVNKKWVLEFCARLQAEKLVLPWKCLVRVDTVDEEMLAAMKRAGCHTAAFGIETGNMEVMKWMRKGITLDQARKTIKLAKKVGINQELYFIIGHKIDSDETIKQTIEFARALNGDFPRFFLFSPYPGSEIYRDLPESFKSKYWLKGTAEDLRGSGNTSICGVPPERLNEYWHKAHDRAYSQLRYFTENVVPTFLANPTGRGWIRKLTNFIGFGVLRAHRLVYREKGKSLLKAMVQDWPKAFL